MTKRITLMFMGLMTAVSMFSQGRCEGSIFDTDGYVNVRKGMSTSSGVVRRLDSGTRVYFSPTAGKWYQVSLSAKGAAIGYVYSDRVETWSSETGKFSSTYEFTVTDPDGYTNVRQHATTKSKIVKRLNTGSYFIGKYAADADGWIGVFDLEGLLAGFVYQTKVKRVKLLVQ